MYLGACVEAGRQLTRVRSFFPPSGSQRLKSGLTASFLPPGPSPWPKSLIAYHCCFPGDAGSHLAVGAPTSSALQ